MAPGYVNMNHGSYGATPQEVSGDTTGDVWLCIGDMAHHPFRRVCEWVLNLFVEAWGLLEIAS
eukprot:13467-Eustigmatos_ZCMA.PRE.1